MPPSPQHVVGVDYGTLSGRAVVVRADDGEELGEAEHVYAHAVMSSELAATGAPLPPNWALQDPDDYVEVLRQASSRDSGVPSASTGSTVHAVKSVAIPTTVAGSTPAAATAAGTAWRSTSM